MRKAGGKIVDVVAAVVVLQGGSPFEPRVVVSLLHQRYSSITSRHVIGRVVPRLSSLANDSSFGPYYCQPLSVEYGW